jgi:AcrR family transcriptional regulator
MYGLSPQHSNRAALVEGTLRCLERLPPERVTARAIADESGANLASIAYHFGSKDALVTEAVVAGLDGWLDEIAARLCEVGDEERGARLMRAADAVEATRAAHEGLARTFLAAMARAQHDERVRETLSAGFARTRPALAALLGLDEDAAGLVLAMFDGLLFQSLVDPGLAIAGDRMRAGLRRLVEVEPV